MSPKVFGLLLAASVLQGCGSVSWPAQDHPLETSGETQLYLNAVEGLIQQGRHAAALAFLDSYAQSGHPCTPQYFHLHGDALLALGRGQEAAADYAKLEGTPLSAYGWNGRGRIAAAAKDWATAKADFSNAVLQGPANADFLNNLAFAQLHLGEAQQSMATLRQARELDPNSPRIRNNLIIALALAGDRRGADVLLSDIRDAGQRDAARAAVSDALQTFNGNRKS